MVRAALFVAWRWSLSSFFLVICLASIFVSIFFLFSERKRKIEYKEKEPRKKLKQQRTREKKDEYFLVFWVFVDLIGARAYQLEEVKQCMYYIKKNVFRRQFVHVIVVAVRLLSLFFVWKRKKTFYSMCFIYLFLLTLSSPKRCTDKNLCQYKKCTKHKFNFFFARFIFNNN